jgi:ribosomal protein S18 acetylase RimI-like enzyme
MRDKQRPCHVWLYFNGAQSVVGYGTLGRTRWRWPTPDSPREWVYAIPWVGIRSEYQGQPPGPQEDRYSRQIIDDLIAEATDRTDSLPILGLFVHPQNQRGQRFFRNAGFRLSHQTYIDRFTQTEYLSMSLPLLRPGRT